MNALSKHQQTQNGNQLMELYINFKTLHTENKIMLLNYDMIYYLIFVMG